MKNFLASLFILTLLSACTSVPKEESLSLKRVSFSDLPGWNEDKISDALPAFKRSCMVLSKGDTRHKSMGVGGKASEWMPPCSELEQVPENNDAALRDYFQRWFRPYKASSSAGSLFTGYYEAELNGSRTAGGKYQTPLWGRPADLITVDLGAFKPELKGQRIAGKVEKSKLVPFDDRAAVSSGSLASRAEPLVWVDDPVGAFFLEIQGSGRINLTDGGIMQLGYDAQNGHSFVPIGRILAEMGEVERPVTMAKIRAWITKHPDRAQQVMNKNPSVVFFRKRDALGAVGAQGVVLTAGRSLAVDPSYVPLGMPLWLAVDEGAPQTIRRLVVAQDTGGAIKGAVRGDYFWGIGPQAEAMAGSMQGRGTYYLLIPITVAVQESGK